MKKTLNFIILMAIANLAISQSAPKAGVLQVVEKSFMGDVIDGYTYYLPKTYESTQQNYPIILYLCGGSSVGGDIDVVKKWPIPKLLVEETDLSLERNQYVLDSFIVVSPHMIAGNFNDRQWYQNDKAIQEILAELHKKFRTDPNRVYLTGLSRGGHGSWGLMSKMGEMFAAAVPIAGDLHGIEGYENMKNMPIWVVHNTGDNLVGHHSSIKAVKALEELTGEEFFLIESRTGEGTSYLKHDRIFSHVPKEGHDAWTDMYESVEFYKWLLKHKKEE